MLDGAGVPVQVAAGLEGGALGTDATAILTALAAADSGEGVVVLMDLGSAVLSAELALELLDDDARGRVVLTAAPLVEGLVVAAVAAAGGADRESVAAEALAGLAGKQAHLGAPAAAAPAAVSPGGDAETASFVVTEPHGLHARPAARLVQQALSAPGAVELRNATTGSGWVSGRSLSGVATLGALQGHRVELRAFGPGARQALIDLVAAASDDAGDAPADDLPHAAVRGVGASPGIGIGPARLLQAARPEVPDEAAADPDAEWERLATARKACRVDLRQTRATAAAQIGERDAEVFDAHLLLLDDSGLLDEAQRRVTAGESAAAAWAAAAQRVQAAFAAMPDPYLQARAADVQAVGDQVLRRLVGGPEPDAELAAVDGVLLAADLTPAQAVALDPVRVIGLVLAHGSPTAHSAILVRARGIPAVVAAGAQVLETAEGTLVALDGETGELVLDPDDAVLGRLRQRGNELAAAGRRAATASVAPARSRDGVRVEVGANLGSLEDARLAAQSGADLAGLVRTEFLFLGRSDAPDVDEQVSVYRALAETMGGRRITLRTLDVGGDKPLPYLPVPHEANPFLGLRGLRLSLAVPGLLADQLLAVVRVAAETPVSVMFPMVTTVEELLAARGALDDAVTRAGRRPAGLQVGMMVEVPAAALKTAAFAPHLDFLSIGTNDLTQYALAAERGNAAVTALGDPYDPGVLRLVAAVCAGAGGATVAVCGELASQEKAVGLLVGLGVRELSVAPRAVPAVKQAVREVHTGRASVRAAAALDAEGPGAVRDLLSS